jgi:hypothetical protein
LDSAQEKDAGAGKTAGRMLSRPRRRAAAELGQNPNEDEFPFSFSFPNFSKPFFKRFLNQI